MTQKEYIANAHKALSALEDSLHWLKRSYEICSKSDRPNLNQ